jgi:DNA polymerase-3 subunit delta
MGTVEKMLKELKRGKVYSTYLLLGEDHGSKEEFILTLKRMLLDEDEMETGTSVYYGDDANAPEIVQTLSTASIFSGKSVVIIREVELLGDVLPLIDYIKSPAQHSLLILLSDKKAVSKRLESAVAKHGKIEMFWPMFQNEGEKWLLGRLRDSGVSAEQDAVKYIVELSGTRKDELNNQVDHIVNFLKKGETLTLERAKTIVARLYRYTVFDLCNRLFVSKPRDTLSVFRYLVTTGEELIKIEYFLSKELRKVMNAYALVKSDLTFSQIEHKLGFRKMEARRIRAIVNRVPLGRIQRLYSRLADLDRTLKSKPKEIGLYAFEKFLIQASG